MPLDSTLDTLRTLVAFDTVSSRSNQALIDWVANGKAGRIPSTLEQRDQAAYDAIVDHIRSLVPPGLWTDLQARRTEFMTGQE